MSSRTFAILLTAILMVAAGVRLWRLDADPPQGVSQDLSLSVDWSWYTAAAVDHARGRENDVHSSYDRPLFSAYARALYALLSPDLVTTNLLSVPAGIAAILLTALAASVLYGREGGILAALLLGGNHAFLVFNRAALLYSWVALVAALTLWLAVKGSRERRRVPVAAAWIVCISSALLLKEITLLVLPALVMGWPVKELLTGSRKAHRWLLGAGLLAAFAAAFAVDLHATLLQKFHDYFLRDEASGLMDRLLTFETRSGLFGAAPCMVSLALVSGLRRRVSREEAMLLVHAVGGIVLFAPLSYSPLRYLLIFFPALAVLGAGVLRSLFRGEATRSPTSPAGDGAVPGEASTGNDAGPTAERGVWRRPLALGLRTARGLLLAYFGYQLCLRAAPESPLLRGGLWLLLVVALAAVGSPLAVAQRIRARLRSPVTALLCLTLALAPQLFRTAVAYALPTYSQRHALREIDCIVSPDAVLSGLYAHSLTLENDLQRRLIPAVRYGKGRLRKSYRDLGVSHLTLPLMANTPEIIRRFEIDGAALRPVHFFHVRRVRVGIYRFPWADEICSLSAYEQGVDAFQGGNRDAAAAHFRRSIADFPHCGAPHAALSEVLLAEGRTREATDHVDAAVRINPSDARALAMKAHLVLSAGRLREGRAVLEEVLRLDPENRAARDLLGRLLPGR
ncbi:MAG: tetratricopeptide repeat protein [Planctomycetota bacterium]|nr:tetratricopeptide repeat protein [Planctomycetota bacterium]